MDDINKYKESIDIDFKTVYQLMANHSERLHNQQTQINNLTKMLDIVKDIVKDIAENKTGKNSIIRKVSDSEMTNLLDGIGSKADKIIMDALSEDFKDG